LQKESHMKISHFAIWLGQLYNGLKWLGRLLDSYYLGILSTNSLPLGLDIEMEVNDWPT
jgi:hypothetical protein